MFMFYFECFSFGGKTNEDPRGEPVIVTVLRQHGS